MKAKSLAKGLATLAFSSSAVADHYFCGDASNSWNNGANWKTASNCSGADAGVPTAADKVTILSGETCNVDVAAFAEKVTVEGTATLNIQASKSLTIDGTDSGNRVSTINGTVNLEGSGSKIISSDNNHTFTGSGKIVGIDDAAEINILTSSKTHTSEITIEGKLKITPGDNFSKFINDGVVNANRHGTLLVETYEIDDVTGAEWRASSATGSGSGGSKLQLNNTLFATGMQGHFIIGAGTFDLDSAIITTGKLVMTHGATADFREGYAQFGWSP